jgi:HTH-type transcriptional regulator / antitoxin HipB
MMIHSPRELAEFAKDYRSGRKLSQSEVGDRVGLRQKTVSAFESKPERTKLETFFRLLSALDLEIQIVPKETTATLSGSMFASPATGTGTLRQIVPKGDTNPAAQGWDQEW